MNHANRKQHLRDFSLGLFCQLVRTVSISGLLAIKWDREKFRINQESAASRHEKNGLDLKSKKLVRILSAIKITVKLWPSKIIIV